MRRGYKINTEELVRHAYKIAEDFKAIDPLILDVGKHCSFTDYFFICSVSSAPQMNAIADNLDVRLKELGARHYGHREGAADARWVLMDYGDFVIHIFLEEARHFYNLEQLWAQATPLS